MIPILKAFRQLLGYCLAAYALLNTPIGVFFLVQFPLIKRYDFCFNTWYIIDVLLCHICHGTGYQRTISGWTGQHMYKHKRYYYQACVIDFLASAVGDGPNHCYRAYLREKELGYIRSNL